MVRINLLHHYGIFILNKITTIALSFLLSLFLFSTMTYSTQVEAGWKTKGALFIGGKAFVAILKSPKLKQSLLNKTLNNPSLRTTVTKKLESFIANSKYDKYRVKTNAKDLLQKLASQGKKTKKIQKNKSKSGKNSNSIDNRPEQVHHYATNKSKKWTSDLKKISDKYNLDLDKDWNKELLKHQGRHPDKYHKFVKDGMEKADRIAKGDTGVFKREFERLVKKPIRDNPDLLRKIGWE